MKTVVTFHTAAESYHMLLPDATPRDVAAVLLAVTPRLSAASFEPGLVAADFVAAISPKVRARLRGAPGAPEQGRVDFAVSHTPILGHRVRCSTAGAVLFDGQLHEFTAWAERDDLIHLRHKVARVKGKLVRVERASRLPSGGLGLDVVDLGLPDLAKAPVTRVELPVGEEVDIVN